MNKIILGGSASYVISHLNPDGTASCVTSSTVTQQAIQSKAGGFPSCAVVAWPFANICLPGGARITILCMLCVSTMLIAPMAQGQSPTKRNDLIGCWQKQIPNSSQVGIAEKGQLTPALQFCFSANGMISGYYVEKGGIAGDLQKTWSFREPSMLIVDEEPCALDYGIDHKNFTLSNCAYRGAWRLECKLTGQMTTCSAK